MRQDFETLTALAKDYGDSFYLIDVDRLRRNLRDLGAAFRAIYPRTVVSYSYKTNYTPLLCRVADEEGCYAEVVSKTEYDLARRLGVRPSRVLFNGPLKSRAEIEEALLAGAIVNLDSAVEIDAVEAVAADHPESVLRVGVRCRFALQKHHRSRFGFAEEELIQVLARLRAIRCCRLQGLHCHFSVRRDLASFQRRAERLVELARIHFADAAPAMLDLGGGLYGPMPESLAEQFGDVPSYEDYAMTVAPIIAAAFPGGTTELVLEPGVGVVADAMKFVCRVCALKRVGGRNVAVTAGSIQNIKATPNAFRLPIRVVSDPGHSGEAVTGPVEITGYTCMEKDVLYDDYAGELRIGDFVILGNVGAYANVLKPPFIRPSPAMLAWSSSSKKFSVARRAERADDLLATYVI